jgi:hypothetical protein
MTIVSFTIAELKEFMGISPKLGYIGDIIAIVWMSNFLEEIIDIQLTEYMDACDIYRKKCPKNPFMGVLCTEF